MEGDPRRRNALVDTAIDQNENPLIKLIENENDLSTFSQILKFSGLEQYIDDVIIFIPDNVAIAKLDTNIITSIIDDVDFARDIIKGLISNKVQNFRKIRNLFSNTNKDSSDDNDNKVIVIKTINGNKLKIIKSGGKIVVQTFDGLSANISEYKTTENGIVLKIDAFLVNINQKNNKKQNAVKVDKNTDNDTRSNKKNDINKYIENILNNKFDNYKKKQGKTNNHDNALYVKYLIDEHISGNNAKQQNRNGIMSRNEKEKKLQERIDKYKKEIEKIVEKLEKTKNIEKKKKLNNKITDLQQKLQNTLYKLASISDKTNIETLKLKRKQIKHKIKVYTKKLKHSKNEKQKQEYQNTIDGLIDEMTDVHDKIVDLKGNKDIQLKNKRDSIKNEIKKLRNENNDIRNKDKIDELKYKLKIVSDTIDDDNKPNKNKIESDNANIPNTMNIKIDKKELKDILNEIKKNEKKLDAKTKNIESEYQILNNDKNSFNDSQIIVLMVIIGFVISLSVFCFCGVCVSIAMKYGCGCQVSKGSKVKFESISNVDDIEKIVV